MSFLENNKLVDILALPLAEVLVGSSLGTILDQYATPFFHSKLPPIPAFAASVATNGVALYFANEYIWSRFSSPVTGLLLFAVSFFATQKRLMAEIPLTPARVMEFFPMGQLGLGFAGADKH